MVAGPDLADLLVVPVVAVLDTPMTPTEVAAAMSSDGVHVAPARAAHALSRAAQMGLARVTGYDGDEARYVATSLGQRSAASLLGDPELQVGLEELERLRTDLLATVGHELRTPLTAIRTSVGLLLDPALDPTDDQRQQLLGTIGRSADRMQQLLTELLDLARLRSGAAEMELTRFDARDLLRDVATAVEPMAAAHDQQLRLELPDDPAWVLGDRRRLEQALLNLAANAQKFSPPSAVIALSVAADGVAVRWTVVDRGPGISGEEQVRLFERFFVGRSERHGAGQGTGIGLPTALAIAQAHRGTIEVESEIGLGSAFHLVVPAA